MKEIAKIPSDQENNHTASKNIPSGHENIPSGHPGQVDFCVGQVTFPTHLLDGQGYEQAARELS